MIVDLSKRWMNQNLPCRRRNPDFFFADHGTETLSNPSRKVQAQWDHVKEVCGACPAMRECARDNLGEIDGIWGGLDPAQRIRLRNAHAYRVRRLEGPLKEEYAKLAYDLREEQKLPWSDVGRIIGIGPKTSMYLHGWWKEHLKVRQAETPKIVDLELPEPVATVTEIHENAQFPVKPPHDGDGWIRYGRRVVWGYYLGQTDDDQWFYMKIKLLAQEYSVCWIKAEDVQLTRPVARNVLVRVGNGSRIYGTTISGREASQAG